jgi:hypothetical protein
MYKAEFSAPNNYPNLVLGLPQLQNRLCEVSESILIEQLKQYLQKMLAYLSSKFNNNEILLTMAQRQLFFGILTSQKMTPSTLL